MKLAVALFTCIIGLHQWAWDRVPDADVVRYFVQTAYLDPNYYPCELCCDEECADLCLTTCVAYSLSAWSLGTTEPQVPESEPTVCTEYDSGDPQAGLVPPLGAVILYSVLAVDSSGNVSQ